MAKLIRIGNLYLKEKSRVVQELGGAIGYRSNITFGLSTILGLQKDINDGWYRVISIYEDINRDDVVQLLYDYIIAGRQIVKDYLEEQKDLSKNPVEWVEQERDGQKYIEKVYRKNSKARALDEFTSNYDTLFYPILEALVQMGVDLDIISLEELS